MNDHKRICIDYIWKEYGIKFPSNVNSREIKADFAMDFPDGIRCFEVEEEFSPLHVRGHIFTQILFNKDSKKISKFIWLVNPRELREFQTKAELLIEWIKPLLKNENILPEQIFDKIP